MRSWPIKTLGEVCDLNPKLGRSDIPDPGTFVSFVPMAAVDEIRGEIAKQESREYGQVAKGYTPFRDNDVLFAKITPCMQNGKSAIARNLQNGLGFGSTEFHVLRPLKSVLSHWIYLFIRQPSFLSAAEASFTGSAGQQRVPLDFLKRSPIPVPPLEDQQRIVKLVYEVDELRKLRVEADRRAASLVPALFQEMFSDFKPRTPLGEIVALIGGSTPPKGRAQLWDGAVPWVSPKDMKRQEIVDSEDHVSSAALSATNLTLLPEDTVLIVVRGMILAHTVPIGISRVPVTINQDLKALVPSSGSLEPEFLRGALVAQHTTLLGHVSTAGHGTKKLDSDRLRALLIPVPPLDLQRRYAESVARVRKTESIQAASKRSIEDAYESIVDSAFRGDL